MDRRRVKFYTGAVILVGAVIRLVYLGIFPPGGEGAVWIRLPVALAGITSIVLFMLFIHKLSKNTQLSLVSGMMLAIMPWHIEQSRVYSQVMLGLNVLLAGMLAVSFFRKKVIRLIVVLLTGCGFYLVYPEFWIFQPNWNVPAMGDYLNNIFKLVSVEFLFYKNDSFWSGGFRTVGVFLPSFIPVLMMGMFAVFQKLQLRHWRYFIPAIVIWSISAANPLFPEGREYFLIVPYLAILSAFGVMKIATRFKNSNYLLRIAILIFLLFVSYEYILFTHFYVVHYSNRIGNEISHDARTF